MSAVQIVSGFSKTNRWLLYASVMLAPAQLISGIGSNCPSNIGFLAYNWYTQISWYWAVRGKQLHALSLLPVHFNLIYAISYLGGITSGNIYMAILLGLGTAGVMIINSISAWMSWATNLPEGYGVYEFFFFGWRTLSPEWHKFFLLWQIVDSMTALSCIIGSISGAIWSATQYSGKEDEDGKIPWWSRYPAIPLGSVVMLLAFWPLILWTELIVARNHIESATDPVAVWLFVAQVVSMMIPSCTAYLGCFKVEV